ncbi:uncharacterized protein LOC143061998 [Mytilus galloprovincialis]|uniref:uncharacterized protein LOC143061998 n=1 Tax=Mytilus galloprovincialis TaxID=29158 RepID=UPI003F7CD19D
MNDNAKSLKGSKITDVKQFKLTTRFMNNYEQKQLHNTVTNEHYCILLIKVLDDLQQNQLFKGCRHILVCEEEKWITREDVFQGLQVLEDRGLTFDLLPTSGLVNDGDLKNWKKEDIQPYVDHVIRCFGIDRCMYGSDWPVCSKAGCKYVDTSSGFTEESGRLRT